jgi:hypothetical protein
VAGGMGAIGAAGDGDITVAGLPPARYSDQCWPRPTIIPVLTTMDLRPIMKARPTAEWHIVCSGSDPTIRPAGHILDTTGAAIPALERTRPRYSKAAKSIVAIVAAAFALAGCAGHPWGPDIDRTAYTCQEYGFYPGTKEFDNCVNYVDARRAKGSGL